jgi:hypothetical protein
MSARAPSIVLPILRAGHPGVTFQSRLAPDYLARLPYAHVRFGERGLRHPRMSYTVSVTIAVTVNGSDADADDLASDIYTTLWTAVKQQITVPQGHITSLTVTAGPAESPLSGQPEGLIRYSATYQLGIRPSSATP